MELAQALAVLASRYVESDLQATTFGRQICCLERTLHPPARGGQLAHDCAETLDLPATPYLVAKTDPSEDVHDRFRIEPGLRSEIYQPYAGFFVTAE
jgi:hypothetical protein